MRKQEFLTRLRKGLSGLPQEDVDERLTFYNEMIEDHMEEGLSEEDAVAAVGSVDEIAKQTLAEIPLTKIARQRIKRRLSAWQIVLLALGSPIWASLLVAAIAVVVSVYAAAWSVIASLWATFLSVAACAAYGIVAGIVLCNTMRGFVMIAAGLICAGVSIFLFHGCKAVTEGIVWATKNFALWLKRCFMTKEAEV